jgi:hypothetical protein
MTSPRNKHTPAQIRAARRVVLQPLIEEMGYRLQPLENNNWIILGLSKKIIIKEHYWSCPENGTGGNAIDLLIQVIGMRFNEAMEKLDEFI